MDKTGMPEPRLEPLPPGTDPALQEAFRSYERALGFVPNSVLIMQRKPKLVRALAQLASAVWDPESEVPLGFKRLIAHVASRAAGCRYCMAHTAGAALRLGIDGEKLEAVWEYRTSPLFSEKERVALDFALAAASQPNDVTDELFASMLRHWSENEIVEIVGVIALFGFMNRWNDTMATPLEAEPIAVGEKHLARYGWNTGKHRR
ncbi:MAG: carboxymuconolactone decarboxylase family protein [Burkholderiales bacterium]